ncbi:MAG: hypothetical protein IKE08_08450 [Clostridia bacterium]|nr:hypothetical protein [Clostridia bacterium]
MKAVWLLKNSFLWYAVTMTSLALVIGGLVALADSIRSRRGNRITMPAGLIAFAAFSVFMILMDCARYAYLSEPDPRYQTFQLALFSLPWGIYAGIEAALAFLLSLILPDSFRYHRSHLMPDAIRETMNLLPEGICISAPDGTVLLSNLQMDNLCRTLTGGVLLDAIRFRERVEAADEKHNEDRLLRTPDGKTWRLSWEMLTESGRGYHLMTAEDITEQYRITETLKEKNEHLQDLQRRIKAVSDLSGEMFVAREKANARAALHNQLGQVLLMGQYWLEHPDSTDAEMVRMTTREMNRILLREAEDLSEEETETTGLGADQLRRTLAMIKNIGVQAEICGELPEALSRRTLLACAIEECASNAVKHAEGDRITVLLEEDDNRLTARISNNGRPPEGPITESGGLLSLRRRTEAAGGQMLVESCPAFSLTLILP